jgi:hypothetical protein
MVSRRFTRHALRQCGDMRCVLVSRALNNQANRIDSLAAASRLRLWYVAEMFRIPNFEAAN